MLKDCKAGEQFKGTVLITDWKESPFRNKRGSFVTLTCQDCSGSLPAKIWEPKTGYFDWLKEKDIFQIEASVIEYRGAVELSILTIQPVGEEKIDLNKLLPSSPFTREILEQRLQKLRDTLQDGNLKNLLDRILGHPEWGVSFRLVPAAVKIHHPYLRGLWEHSLNVTDLARSMAIGYPEVNSNLLVVGALLHDIGKIFEYNYERGISFTTDGRLLGHIIMGVDLISREIAGIADFPADLRTKLLHIITSHHGRYEWQSPRRPKYPEAIIIHYADALEVDLWQYQRAKQDNPQEEWSPYVRSMERCLYLDQGKQY
ncbi:MAG TPA: HD domain-containing protein [Desulfitobacteriaceae bacterium]|nr:HD domain-containing protein [Desulfitobacteriaceae bacterium]